MIRIVAVVLVVQAVLAAAAPADPVLGKFSEGLRYDYMETDAGELRLVDNWVKLSDYNNLVRYNPDQSNVYHLFTRQNPSLSQPLVVNNPATVINSNYDPQKRTVILMHGFAGSATSSFNTNLVPAFLAGDDCNVIILDWSAGSFWGPRAKEAGQAGGRFANWLISLTGANANQFTVVGYSVGGHGAGFISRTMTNRAGYVIACDPADRWEAGEEFKADDGLYTEVIHTSAGNIGATLPLGQVDFYPNQGTLMPGCITSICHHERSFHYVAESMRTGGFTGWKCVNVMQALTGNCTLQEILNMGGILPKPGRTGIFFLRTNSQQPFSQG